MTMFEFNEKNILDTLSVHKEDPEEWLKIITQFKNQCGELSEFLARQEKFFKNYKKQKNEKDR